MDVTVTIDNIKVTVPEGTKILAAAKQVGIKIPTLCYHPDLPVKGSCRLCLVEVKGQKKLKTSCSTEVEEGMEISTTSKVVRDERRTILELILANHPQDCLTCVRNGNCELQTLAKEMGIRGSSFAKLTPNLPIDQSNPSIIRDPNKCIKCGRCVEVCQEVQTVGAITLSERSGNFEVSTAFRSALDKSPCVYCGQCITVCPVGALYEKDDTAKVWRAIDNPDLHVVVQVAPAVRIAIGEEFGMKPGTIMTGKLVTALRMMGFDKVFDTDFAADVTIMEEGQELLERITKNQNLPLLTSCSPGWINYIETFYPDLLNNVSTCKSPQQMFGALAKTYYADTNKIEREKMFVVSVMPCTAKKAECVRPEMNASGNQDVDVVVTTRELARMLRQAGIQLSNLQESEFDVPLGISTGAAVIFGTTGGVMEAALRTVYEKVTGTDLEHVDFESVRGLSGIKTAEVDLNGTIVKIAVVSGLANAKIILDEIRQGTCEYHFIEVMCCPGGCIAGGGQPQGVTKEDIAERMQGIYEVDRQKPIRKSHLNPAVQTLYSEYLNTPDVSVHQLLHTSYKHRVR